jgi:sigma-B regulation protein RsbU (phosphoserine phosphatase)
MAVTITALKVTSANMSSLPAIMEAVNRHLCFNNASQMFVTVLAGIIDTRTGEIEYVDGGHEPPFVLAHDGTVRMIEKVQGLALGFSPEFAFTGGRIVLGAGDSLVVYTDGFNEAMNAQGAMFQTPTIGATLAAGPRESARSMGQGLIARLEDFVGTAPQSDDRTLLVLRYQPASPAAT